MYKRKRKMSFKDGVSIFNISKGDQGALLIKTLLKNVTKCPEGYYPYARYVAFMIGNIRFAVYRGKYSQKILISNPKISTSLEDKKYVELIDSYLYPLYEKEKKEERIRIEETQKKNLDTLLEEVLNGG